MSNLKLLGIGALGLIVILVVGVVVTATSSKPQVKLHTELEAAVDISMLACSKAKKCKQLSDVQGLQCDKQGIKYLCDGILSCDEKKLTAVTDAQVSRAEDLMTAVACPTDSNRYGPLATEMMAKAR